MFSLAALDSRSSAARFLYKLAIVSTRMAYRKLPLDSVVSALSGSTPSPEALTSSLTPAKISKMLDRRKEELKNLNKEPPKEVPSISGRPRLLHVAAARTIADGDSPALQVNAIFGPTYIRIRAGVPSVVTSSGSFIKVEEVATHIESMFGAPGKASLLFQKLIPEDENSYRIEMTTRGNSDNEQYAIVHVGGPNAGSIVKTKFVNANGVESYRDAVFSTARRANQELSTLTRGIPVSTSSVSPQSTSIGHGQLLRAMIKSDLLLTEENSPDVYPKIAALLGLVDKESSGD